MYVGMLNGTRTLKQNTASGSSRVTIFKQIRYFNRILDTTDASDRCCTYVRVLCHFPSSAWPPPVHSTAHRRYSRAGLQIVLPTYVWSSIVGRLRTKLLKLEQIRFKMFMIFKAGKINFSSPAKNFETGLGVCTICTTPAFCEGMKFCHGTRCMYICTIRAFCVWKNLPSL